MKPCLIFAGFALLTLPSHAITFVEQTSAAGVSYFQHQYPDSGPGSLSYTQIYMAGGAAAGDFDNDGWVDLYVTRLDDSNILFRNRGDGTFGDYTTTAFGANHLSTFLSNGCAWGDIDNDGDLDLYVTHLDTSFYHLYINDGAGNFTSDSFNRGVSAFVAGDTKYGQSATFGDYDLDGYLDLHITEWRFEGQNLGGHPHNDRLFRNQGASNPGYFTDVTNSAGVATDLVPRAVAGYDAQGFAPRFSDIDRDGRPDLLLASDHGSSRLWWGTWAGTFIDGTVAANVGTDQFGMGSTLGDYDMDGDLDWFVTSIFRQGVPGRNGNRLYRYDGGRVFSDDTDGAGVRDGQWGWAASFSDFDHDRDLDLIQTNGAYFPFSPNVSAGYENDPTRMWENDGTGNFTDVAGVSGVSDTASGKGLLTFDYDRDGDLDVFIVNNGSTPVLYENTGADGTNWLIIRPVGTQSNRQGLGAFVTVVPEFGDVPLIREVNGGSNFLGQDEVMAHYGLGTMAGTTVASVQIEWPSGEVQTFTNVPMNKTYYVTEPLGLTPTIALSMNRLPSGEMQLEWPSVLGQEYEIQVCGNLGIPHWTLFDSEVAAGTTSSRTITSVEQLALGSGAYFRVVKK